MSDSARFQRDNRNVWRKEGSVFIFEAGGSKSRVWVDQETDSYVVEVDGEILPQNSATLHSAKERGRRKVNKRTKGQNK